MLIDDIEYVIFSHSDLTQIREFMDGPSSVAVVGGSSQGLDHGSFECRDFDDIGIGKMAIVDEATKHRWGIHQHFYGSQVLTMV